MKKDRTITLRSTCDPKAKRPRLCRDSADVVDWWVAATRMLSLSLKVPAGLEFVPKPEDLLEIICEVGNHRQGKVDFRLINRYQ